MSVDPTLPPERWKEIRAFAQGLTDWGEAEEEVWVRHTSRCDGCWLCDRHALYHHILEALEQWERRSPPRPPTPEESRP